MEIGNWTPVVLLPVQSAISDFEFQMQESSNFKISNFFKARAAPAVEKHDWRAVRVAEFGVAEAPSIGQGDGPIGRGRCGAHQGGLRVLCESAITRSLRQLDPAVSLDWVKRVIAGHEEADILRARNDTLRTRPENVKAFFEGRFRKIVPTETSASERSGRRPRTPPIFAAGIANAVTDPFPSRWRTYGASGCAHHAKPPSTDGNGDAPPFARRLSLSAATSLTATKQLSFGTSRTTNGRLPLSDAIAFVADPTQLESQRSRHGLGGERGRFRSADLPAQPTEGDRERPRARAEAHAARAEQARRQAAAQRQAGILVPPQGAFDAAQQAPSTASTRARRFGPPRASSGRKFTATVAPLRASIAAVASPMPDAPPVTSAVLPARS